ncbi:MAG: hypothetical protein WDO74_19100 [Pseudomonadota bacterium]
MARSTVQEDDVGLHPSRVSVAPGAFATLPAPAPSKCEALFELFRGGAGSVHLGRLHDGKNSTQLVAMRRLASLPTRQLEFAMANAQRIAHPRLTKMLGTYQYEDAWYLASEYASGVTLFELGQAAVRQRTPVAAAVAVRIVLDALTVTAEAEQLLGENVGSARCLYPESIWISDSGKLFMSEILVAPVLARSTTGASYVALTPGMSVPASDVRAAAVELARLACARLMNGNPASWQTRELPNELSELLARAIIGGQGTETPAAFANALSALPPHLIGSREAVQEELERLMGPERLRRREQLDELSERAADSDTTRVFRVAHAAAVPSIAKTPSSVRPPDLSAARRARASTVPPPRPRAAVAQAACPTPTIPAPALTPAPPVSAADSPISGVWREAHERMGPPGRRARRRTNPGEMATMTPAPVLAPAVPEPPSAPAGSRRIVFVALVVFALSALVGATWLSRGSSGVAPGAAQHAP